MTNLHNYNLSSKNNEQEDENDSDRLVDNLAESMEYLSRISPTTMPEWMN